MTFNDLRYEIAVHSPPGAEKPARIWANHIDLMDVMVDIDKRIADGIATGDQFRYVGAAGDDAEHVQVKQRPEGWAMTIDGVDVHRDGTLPRGSIRVDHA